ncbi:MAG: arylsulfatase [Saprospiraceae bacterium]|nr:arylsulfatase [Saprospiraceae bacterium]
MRIENMCFQGALVAMILLLFGSCGWKDEGSSNLKEEPARPNVIHIMLDEWGYFESSMMGHPIIETPHIDQFAREGMRFSQFLAGGSVCAPTRSVLMTGQHLGHTTVRTNGGGQALRDEDVTIAEMLRHHGYATGGFGKWGIGDRGSTGVPEKQGFDIFFGYYHQVHAHSYYPRYLVRNSNQVPLEGNTGDPHAGQTFSHTLIHEEGLAFIRQHHDTPFYAYLAWTPPHGHWHMPEDDPAWLKYKERDWDAPNQRGQHDAKMYAAMIEMADRQIGELLALLKKLEIDEETIIFISGDNGGQDYFSNAKYPDGFFAPNVNPKTGVRFRGGKRQFYEGGLRIPFIVRWPGKIAAGSQSDHLGYFPDIMPTIAALTGAPLLSKSDGHSIAPTLLGRGDQESHQYLYWEGRGDLAIRRDNWKAIKPAQDAPFELYDLEHDIGENHNVAVEYPSVLEELIQYGQQAHSQPTSGMVLDTSVGFKGHFR